MKGPNKPKTQFSRAWSTEPTPTSPTIHERNINVKVIDSGGPEFHVTASLFDLEHNFHAELVVEIRTGRIVDARAVMAKRPYENYCLKALENVAQLKGETIGRGINRRLNTLLGRNTGCFHLVEVFLAAVGFTATILLGKRSGIVEESGISEEESRKRWFPVLKNTCQVFRAEKEENH